MVYSTFGYLAELGVFDVILPFILIFTLVIGQVQISPAVYSQLLQSVRIAFVVFALLCFAGIFSSMVRGKLHST